MLYVPSVLKLLLIRLSCHFLDWKPILSDISMATLLSFGYSLQRISFSILSLSTSLCLWISGECLVDKYIVGLCVFIHYAHLCLLIGEFNQLHLKKLLIRRDLTLSLCYLFSLCPVVFSPSFTAFLFCVWFNFCSEIFKSFLISFCLF